MGFFNNFPYTDFHELNADWLLKEMQELDARLDAALAQLSADIYNKVMTDIRPELNAITSQFVQLRSDFDVVKGQVTDLDAAFELFKADVEDRLVIMQNYINSMYSASMTYTNNAIEQNNIYILSELSTYLNQVKVINFFTGELVSIQDMFNYLAGLHTTDSIDYSTMALRALTYTQLANKNKTYTELVLDGNNWYV